MINNLVHKIIQDKENSGAFDGLIKEITIAPKTILLKEGEISRHAHFIKEGCMREWFSKDGKDITFQFFFENQPVASIDSFINGIPSPFTIESIEHSRIFSISKKGFQKIFQVYPEFKDGFDDFIFQRFRNYSQLFLSRIKDSPQERYNDLLKNHPEIIQRVPQHYIASYLGITSVSLSRIRNRK